MASVTTTYDYEGPVGSAATQATAESVATPASGTTHQVVSGGHGGTGIQVVATAANSPVVDHSSTMPFNPLVASTQQEVRGVVVLPVGGYAVDQSTVGQYYGGSTGSATVARLKLNLDNSLVMYDATATHQVTLLANAAPYFGTAIGIHLIFDTGTTITSGTFKGRVHANPADPVGTFIAGSDVAPTANWNLGSDTGTAYPITKIRWGVGTVQGVAGKTLQFDYTQIKSESTTFTLAGPPAGTAPTANAGPDQYGQAGSFTYNGGSSVAGSGTISTYAWTVIEYPAGTSNPSLSAPAASTGTVTVAPGRTVLQLIVTNSSGIASAADTIIIWAYPASNANVQVYVAPNGASNWTNEGGAPSMTTALNDSNNATSAKSPPSPVNEPLPVIMNPYGPGSIALNVEGVAIGGPVNRTITMTKEDGTTVIGTLGPFALPVITEANAANPTLLAAALAIATLTVGSTGLAAVPALSDRRALRWTVSDNG